MHPLPQCPVCSSEDYITLNTYKHYAHVCNDCNSVFHTKKNKYLLERLLPSRFIKKLLPRKAFLRLFRDEESPASEFYDVYTEECLNISEWRKSEYSQIKDILAKAKLSISPDWSVLDVSGGPGFLGYQLQKECAKVVVTEYSQASSNAISNQFGLKTAAFDYTKEVLSDKVSGPFDLIMIRSSIIFCPDLDKLVKDMCRLLSANGHILIETILPTYGEIFWWQQLEYKFPIIYSQQSIESTFYRHGFKPITSFRDYGSYFGVKARSYKALSRQLFTWLLELPMIYIYLIFNWLKKPAIDTTLRHKMFTCVWARDSSGNMRLSSPKPLNFYQGKRNKSKTFGYLYNDYLSR